MPLQTAEAIVIRAQNLGEADRAITFYTRGKGKVRAVAEGIRRIRSRFSGSLELFAFGTLVYFERLNKTLHRINEFALLEPFQHLREDLELLIHGSYLLELTDASVEEGEVNEELFFLLLQALRSLAAGREPALLHRAFEIRLLKILGYLPELRSCVLCRISLPGSGTLALSPSQGGLLCPECQPGVRDSSLLSRASLTFLWEALRTDFVAFIEVKPPQEVGVELAELLRGYLSYFLGRSFRSVDFLARLSAFSKQG